MKDDEVEVAVQVNGKTRAVISVPADISKEDAIVQGKEAVKDKMAGNIVKRDLRSRKDHQHLFASN